MTWLTLIYSGYNRNAMGIRVTIRDTAGPKRGTVQVKHILMSFFLTISICSAVSIILFYIKFNQWVVDDTVGHMLCYKQPIQKNEEKEPLQSDTPHLLLVRVLSKLKI